MATITHSNQSSSSEAFVVMAVLNTLLCMAAMANERVYEILPKYDLLSDLLPDTVIEYMLNEDGQFVVVLAKPCYIQFYYLVYYETKISDKLSGSITNLKAIQVQCLFIWFNVDEIRVDLPPSNNIYFQVDIINKKLDVDQFKIVRSYRKSLSCPPCLP